MKTTLLFLFIFLSASLFGQNVYIPDANFKSYLVGNPEINTNGDTEIQVSEASAFDGLISCGFQNISDLTGIEAFTTVTSLICSHNTKPSYKCTLKSPDNLEVKHWDGSAWVVHIVLSKNNRDCRY